MTDTTPIQVTLAGPGVCKHCGCTDAWACGGGCYWIDEEHTLCSKCVTQDELRACIKDSLQNLPESCGAYDEPDDDEECCQNCGCSESSRCEAGCEWVNEDKSLCSGCAVPKPEGCTCSGDWFGEEGDCALHPSCDACMTMFGEVDLKTGLLKPGKCECGQELPAEARP